MHGAEYRAWSSLQLVFTRYPSNRADNSPPVSKNQHRIPVIKWIEMDFIEILLIMIWLLDGAVVRKDKITILKIVFCKIASEVSKVGTKGRKLWLFTSSHSLRLRESGNSLRIFVYLFWKVPIQSQKRWLIQAKLASMKNLRWRREERRNRRETGKEISK